MVAAALVILAGALVAAALLNRSTEPALRGVVRRKCLVSCKDGQTYSGVLWSADRGCFVLKNASVIGDGGTAALDGEVLLMRSDVAFVQIP